MPWLIQNLGRGYRDCLMFSCEQGRCLDDPVVERKVTDRGKQIPVRQLTPLAIKGLAARKPPFVWRCVWFLLMLLFVKIDAILNFGLILAHISLEPFSCSCGVTCAVSGGARAAQQRGREEGAGAPREQAGGEEGNCRGQLR